jgi:hypothetical protein
MGRETKGDVRKRETCATEKDTALRSLAFKRERAGERVIPACH